VDYKPIRRPDGIGVGNGAGEGIGDEGATGDPGPRLEGVRRARRLRVSGEDMATPATGLRCVVSPFAARASAYASAGRSGLAGCGRCLTTIGAIGEPSHLEGWLRDAD